MLLYHALGGAADIINNIHEDDGNDIDDDNDVDDDNFKIFQSFSPSDLSVP